MESFVLLCMPVCICVPYVRNPGVHGRFYGLDLKKEEIVVLEKKP